MIESYWLYMIDSWYFLIILIVPFRKHKSWGDVVTIDTKFHRKSFAAGKRFARPWCCRCQRLSGLSCSAPSTGGAPETFAAVEEDAEPDTQNKTVEAAPRAGKGPPSAKSKGPHLRTFALWTRWAFASFWGRFNRLGSFGMWWECTFMMWMKMTRIEKQDIWTFFWWFWSKCPPAPSKGGGDAGATAEGGDPQTIAAAEGEKTREDAQERVEAAPKTGKGPARVCLQLWSHHGFRSRVAHWSLWPMFLVMVTAS